MLIHEILFHILKACIFWDVWLCAYTTQVTLHKFSSPVINLTFTWIKKCCLKSLDQLAYSMIYNLNGSFPKHYVQGRIFVIKEWVNYFCFILVIVRDLLSHLILHLLLFSLLSSSRYLFAFQLAQDTVSDPGVCVADIKAKLYLYPVLRHWQSPALPEGKEQMSEPWYYRCGRLNSLLIQKWR